MKTTRRGRVVVLIAALADGDCEAIMAWLQIGCIRFRRPSYSEPAGHRLAVPAVREPGASRRGRG